MDNKWLQNFIEIVESGSLSAAAKKVYIAQPALSNQLKTLEKELGTPLLIRNSRHQELTEAGRILFEKAKHMVALEQSIREEIEDTQTGGSGLLRLGMTPSTALTMLDGVLSDFCRAYPQTRFELHEVDSYQILDLLENGVIDVGVVRTPCNLTQAMEVHAIAGEDMIAAFQADAFSLSAEPHIPLAALERLPLVCIKRYEPLLMTACQYRNVVPFIKCLNIHLSVSLAWARAGLGVAIVPFSSFDTIRDNDLSYKIIDEPFFETQRAIVRMKERYHPILSELFYQYCQDRFPTDAAGRV